MGEIIGEEGLLIDDDEKKKEDGAASAAAFVGLQFLCFPAMTVVLGEEEDDVQAPTATQELMATVTGAASAPTPGGLERAGG